MENLYHETALFPQSKENPLFVAQERSGTVGPEERVGSEAVDVFVNSCSARGALRLLTKMFHKRGTRYKGKRGVFTIVRGGRRLGAQTGGPVDTRHKRKSVGLGMRHLGKKRKMKKNP